MAEVGRLRSRAMGRAFLVSWVVASPLWILARLGLVGAGVLGAATAAAIAKAWVAVSTQDFIDSACKKHGIDPKTLASHIIE
jgi:hypothetical protein